MSSAEDDDDDDTIQFLDLNDDCLLEIFKHLSLQETFSLLGSLCQRIDNIIYESLSRVKHLSINMRDPPQFNVQQLEILGCNLTSIYISVGYSLASPLTLHYLEPICKQQNLQSLTLHYVQFSEHFQQCVIKVAGKLQFLDLSYCQLTDDLLAPVLEQCCRLKTLAIFGNYRLACVSLNCLKSKYLEELKVEQNSLSRTEIQRFKANNPQVTVSIFSIGNLNHFRNLDPMYVHV